MLNFRPGLNYLRTVLENKNEWDRQKPTAIGGNIILVDYYTKLKLRSLKQQIGWQLAPMFKEMNLKLMLILKNQQHLKLEWL
jgi:hypothetical protein